MSMKKGIKKFGRQIEIQIFALAGVMYLLLFFRDSYVRHSAGI